MVLGLVVAASTFLVPGRSRSLPSARPAVQMVNIGGGDQRVGPPPDLPSMLLNNRIIYMGAPIVPSVTELVVAQLLFLNYESKDKPVFMYINSVGAAGAYETEAFAVADTMNYVGPDIETICIGTAFGTAAMLLANGKKGSRACLPNASIMLMQPRSQARGQASDIKIKATEVLKTRNTINSMLAESTGQTVEKIMLDSSRTKYLSPEEAMAYGLIDKVVGEVESAKPAFLAAL